MKKKNTKQLERKLRIMRFAPWAVLAVVSLFVVPKYLDANETTARLSGKLLEAEALPSELESINNLLEKEQQRTAQLSASLVSAENMHQFQNRVVAIARSSGCKVRRMTEGARNAQSWVPGMPLVRTAGGAPTGSAPSEGLMQLETQEMNLELTGTLAQLKRFLDGFQQTAAYAHTRTFSLSQLRGDNTRLELSIILLNLTPAKSDQHA